MTPHKRTLAPKFSRSRDYLRAKKKLFSNARKIFHRGLARAVIRVLKRSARRPGCSRLSNVGSCGADARALRGDGSLLAGRGQTGHLRPPARERLQPIVSRVLERVGKSGEVEHALDEVVERAAIAHHRCGKMDQLARTLADDVHAENALTVWVEDQLHETLGLTQDLSAWIRAKKGTANLARKLLRQQRLFRLP